MRLHLFKAGLVVGVLTLPVSGSVIHVPADHPTIQGAIDAAANGDTVLVAPGTYNEAINFNGKALVLESSGGRDATIINAAGTDTSAVKIMDTQGAGSTVIDGFTITGGTGTFVSTPVPSVWLRYGGGMHITMGNTIVRRCAVVNNSANAQQGIGGGVYVNAGVLTMTDCVIQENVVWGSGLTSSSGTGGGLHSSDSSVMLRDCSIMNNHVSASSPGAGSVSARGGGLRIVGNGASAELINCIISGNSVDLNDFNNNGVGSGGAMAVAGTVVFHNCLVANNQSHPKIKSPGIASTASLNVINCTIANNLIDGPIESGTVGGIITSGGSATIANTILFGNAASQVAGSLNITASCVEGGAAGDGIIDADPAFVAAGDGNYRLTLESPCRDVGVLSAVPPDILDFDQDGTTKEPFPVDLLGMRRVVNGYVDMGAHEWQRTCEADISPSSPGVAGNGIVDVDDLLVVINGWGECDVCVADVNGDNSVNVDDLLAVINGWGSCK